MAISKGSACRDQAMPFSVLLSSFFGRVSLSEAHEVWVSESPLDCLRPPLVNFGIINPSFLSVVAAFLVPLVIRRFNLREYSFPFNARDSRFVFEVLDSSLDQVSPFPRLPFWVFDVFYFPLARPKDSLCYWTCFLNRLP